MANEWLRLWHDMPNDPKWRTISRACGLPISLVQSTYVHLLVDASRNVTRGHATVTTEDLASALDVKTQEIESILAAMQGRVLDGMLLLGWEKRQPKREEYNNGNGGAKTPAQRKREQRERERAEAELLNESSSVTQCHAESRNVTTDKDKEEDKENIKTTSSSSDDLRACPVGSLVNLYHEMMPSNPRVKTISEARKGAIRQRWREASSLTCYPFGYKTREEGLEAWRNFFGICAESEFLTGRTAAQPGKPPFIADIDFLFSPSGFAKTLENKYHRAAA